MSYKDTEATDKQYALMEKLGIEYDPAGVSIGEARALIEAKLGKKPKDITSNYSQGSNNLDSIGPDKDTLIVRQSCLKAAVELVSEKVKQEVDKNELAKAILITAEEFEKWVFRDGK